MNSPGRSHPACLLFALVVACGPSNSNDPPDAAPSPVSLSVSPPSATLEVIDGAAASQSFAATLTYDDGSTRDVSAEVIFSVDNFLLGGFQGPLFSATGSAGGRGTVTALAEGFSAQAEIVVIVKSAQVIEPAPADAAALFESAAEEPTLAPTIVYPSDATMVPPNLGDFDVHWTGIGGADLFQVTLANDYVELQSYALGTPNAGSWIAVPPSQWVVAAASDRSSPLTITVRGMQSGDPSAAGTSAPISVRVAGQTIQGGIYYWASQAVGGPGGIYRYDMGAVGQVAERFYTTDESPNGRCVACHALSRDGTRMALTFDGGNGASTILDVASRQPILPLDPSFAWNFATFDPSAERIVTVTRGALQLRSVSDGTVITNVPTAGYATHPDFSPQGDAIVYTQVAAPSADWYFTGGSIVTQPYDAASDTFGAPTVLVDASAGNNYYPSWSPDGQWIMFNRSSEDAYDDGTAELYVVKRDGTSAPTRLDLPNIGPGLTNSWARWAPFAQIYDTGVSQSEPFFWFTFSSKRNFGVRLVGANRPQVWMAPFFPGRALAGDPASAPAFRLPAQDLSGSNHIAQWTEEVIPIE